MPTFQVKIFKRADTETLERVMNEWFSLNRGINLVSVNNYQNHLNSHIAVVTYSVNEEFDEGE